MQPHTVNVWARLLCTEKLLISTHPQESNTDACSGHCFHLVCKHLGSGGSYINIDNGRPVIYRKTVATEGNAAMSADQVDKIWSTWGKPEHESPKTQQMQQRKSIKSKKLLHFASCWWTKMENKVLLNVSACKVNKEWGWVNNWSHISDTFNCSLSNN